MADALTLRTRIAKIAGRFGSDFEGERATAALLASRILREHGATWSDVLAPGATTFIPRQSPPPPAQAERKSTPVHHKMVAPLLLRPGLRCHERRFLQSILDQASLTRIQSHVLISIRARLDDHAGRRGDE